MANDLPPLPKTFVGCAILQLLAGAVALNAGTISLIWGCMLGYIATGIWVGSVVSIICPHSPKLDHKIAEKGLVVIPM